MKPITKRILAAVLIIGIVGITASTLLSNKKEVEAKVYRRNPDLKPLVRAYTVEEKPFETSLQLIGTFEPNRQVEVIAETQGKVTYVGIEKGQIIQSGRLIARFDDDMLQAQLKEAKAQLAKAQQDVKRYEKIIAGEAAPKIRLDEANLTLASAESRVTLLQEQIGQMTITAPFTGIVTDKMFEYGTVVASGGLLAKLIDISKVKLSVDVPENNIGSIKTGEALTIQTDVYPGKEFTGKVITVGSQADDAHTYEVEVLVNNSSDNPLKSGMYGFVSLDSKPGQGAIAIPREALVGSAKKPQVYVVENGVAKLHTVTVGASNGNQLQILSGLKAGEQVVTSGQINLSDSTAVAVAK